jgi:predicted DNA-binding protein (MmcQ/YjbR family)
MAKKPKIPKLPEDWVRDYCMSLPHATEDIQWEKDLLFRVGGKIFAGIPIEFPSHHWLSFKCTPQVFAELTQREGIAPAPYVARYHWVSILRHENGKLIADIRQPELKKLIRTSYDLVLAGLPKKMQAKLGHSK